MAELRQHLAGLGQTGSDSLQDVQVGSPENKLVAYQAGLVNTAIRLINGSFCNHSNALERS